MGKAQETSLLFSLESLMREERGRVERERDEARERERERERQRVEAAERLARQREEAARQRGHELAERARAEREEQARLAAIRDAEIERVRLEAEARTAQEVRARELAHLVELERTRAVTRANTRRLALVTSGVLAIGSAIGAAAVQLGSSSDEVTQPGVSFQEELSQERQRVAQLERNLKAERERFENAQRALEQRPSAPSAEAPTGPSPQREHRRGPAPTRPPRTNGAETKRPCRGDPNDPLNPCLNP
jgi:colicin import membrane protein